MQIASAKQKGKRFEQWIADQIRDAGIDSRAGREIGSGSGKAKGDVRTTLDFLIEAKNQQSIHFLADTDQARSQARTGYHNPDKWALILRDPRFPEFQNATVTIDFFQFLSLYKKAMEPKTVSPDRAFKYDLENLKRGLSKVIKQLE